MSVKKKIQKRKPSGKPAGVGLSRFREERENKDHVLQARVSSSMYDKLVEQASRLRVPVSNLVRNILEDSIRMVGNIVEGSLEIAEVLGTGVSDKELSEVLGWQPLVANRRLTCNRCGKAVEKGDTAMTSVGSPTGRTIVICEGCKCNL